MADHLEYEQYLTDKIKKGLDSQEFKPLMDKILTDPDLSFEIRKGHPIVYYHGCKIIEITTNKLKLSIDKKYARKKRREKNTDPYDIDPEAERILTKLNDSSYNYS